MQWRLLNQFFVNLESKNLEASILEEVLSSELQLVQLLVSGLVSPQTGMLLSPGTQWNNQQKERGL